MSFFMLADADCKSNGIQMVKGLNTFPDSSSKTNNCFTTYNIQSVVKALPKAKFLLVIEPLIDAEYTPSQSIDSMTSGEFRAKSIKVGAIQDLSDPRTHLNLYMVWNSKEELIDIAACQWAAINDSEAVLNRFFPRIKLLNQWVGILRLAAEHSSLKVFKIAYYSIIIFTPESEFLKTQLSMLRVASKNCSLNVFEFLFPLVKTSSDDLLKMIKEMARYYVSKSIRKSHISILMILLKKVISTKDSMSEYVRMGLIATYIERDEFEILDLLADTPERIEASIQSLRYKGEIGYIPLGIHLLKNGYDEKYIGDLDKMISEENLEYRCWDEIEAILKRLILKGPLNLTINQIYMIEMKFQDFPKGTPLDPKIKQVLELARDEALNPELIRAA